MAMPDLSRFQAKGLETCFHGRHLEPIIYAGLDGSNWRLEGEGGGALGNFFTPSGRVRTGNIFIAW